MSQPATSTDVAQRTPQQELVARVRNADFQAQLALVLPESVSPERFGRVFGTALLNSPELAEAEPTSIMSSLLRIAEMGLMPDGREAAVVTFFSKKKQVLVAQPIAMIAGLRRSVADHGWTLRTQVVYANDEFEHVLTPVEEVRRHRPVRPGGERGELHAAYAIATHKDGRREVKVLYADDIAKIKATSRAIGPGTPWVEWKPQMWAKSAGRALVKELPITDRDRVDRVLEASRMEPVEAAAAIYGPSAHAALEPGETVDSQTGEISSTAASADGGGTVVAPDDQQAEGVAPKGEPDTDLPSSPPTPSAPDDEPALTSGGPSQEETEKAGQAKIPKGSATGATLAEALAEDTGPSWAAWALKDPKGYWTPTFRRKLEVYVQAQLPEVFAAWQAEQPQEA